MDSTPEHRRSWLQRLLGITQHVTSEEHLQELIHASEEGGIINAEEGEMFSSIFEFGETIVREVMIPRTEMRSCPVDASVETLIDMVLHYGHSRIPVYEQTIDHIVGLVYAKDLLKFWGKPEQAVSLRDLMRKPYFVPETKRIEELLQEFRGQRMHIAIAIDEYGGTSGLITLEDLIEEIIGDIKDEYDVDDNLLVEEEPGVIVMDARTGLDELEDYYDLPEFERDQFDSVGGLLLHRLGYVPKPGEEVVIEPLKMVILQSDERMIQRVRIFLENPEDEQRDE
ncbi:MAG: HlyC/CorC family transporter [Desulfuromonas sp.]|nr:MAG: HlyC/CorC family transporter [Desulfuromonas sp.]